MSDLQEIANAIATTIGTLTATSSGVTESLTATADLPDNIGTSALLVYPPTGSLELILGPRHQDLYTFPVKMLRDPLSVTPRTRWLYAWTTAMRTGLERHFQLGLSYVTNAEAKRVRVELDGEQYASSGTGALGTFDVVELEVEVTVWELTTLAL